LFELSLNVSLTDREDGVATSPVTAAGAVTSLFRFAVGMTTSPPVAPWESCQ
jgi:hypothetical protein